MKKLVYIANNRIPAERAYSIQITQMCVEFAKICDKRGWYFELVVPQRYLQAGADIFTYHGFKKTFNVVYLACFDAIHLMPWLGKIAYWLQSITFIFSLLAWFFKQKEDVVAIYTREFYIAAIFSGSIFEMHSLPEKPSLFFRILLRRCKNIVVITNALKQDLVAFGINSNTILVAPDGIDLERFDNSISKEVARRELNIPIDKFVVVYTGSFFQHAWKGVDILLGAVKKLKEKDILFILVGGHPEEDELTSEFHSYSNLRIIGHTSFQGVKKYLATADAVVIPNKSGYHVSERHTSPLKLFEYMAARRVIIAARLPSIMEVVDESCAIFFEPNNVDDLAQKIYETFLDNKGCDQKIDEAYERVKSYTWARRANSITEIL